MCKRWRLVIFGLFRGSRRARREINTNLKISLRWKGTRHSNHGRSGGRVAHRAHWGRLVDEGSRAVWRSDIHVA